MALRLKIDKRAYDKLSDEMKELYVERDDGKGFQLDVDGLEDVQALKDAKQREVDNAKELRKELREARDRVSELEAAANNKDLDKANEKVEKLTKKLHENAIKAVAEKMATKISNAPKLLLPHILENLVSDIDDDGNVTVAVKGPDGKASNKTLDAFEKETVANKEFAAIIVTSKASGGGGASREDPSAKGGGAANRTDNNGSAPPNLATMNPKDLAAHLREKREARQQQDS